MSHTALKESLAQCLEDLYAQRVCVLKTILVSCAVEPQLSGAKVKVKCRGITATYIKSEIYGVPEGGGQIDFLEPTGDLVYEGDEELHFKLCRVHPWWRWRSSSVVASGTLSLATVLGTVGLGGDTFSWILPLMSKDGRLRLASLEVKIRCLKGKLGNFGGVGALKKLALPERPFLSAVHVVAVAPGATPVRVEGARITTYCIACRRATAGLKQAKAHAIGLAKARNVEVKRAPPRCEDNGEESDDVTL